MANRERLRTHTCTSTHTCTIRRNYLFRKSCRYQPVIFKTNLCSLKKCWERKVKSIVKKQIVKSLSEIFLLVARSGRVMLHMRLALETLSFSDSPPPKVVGLTSPSIQPQHCLSRLCVEFRDIRSEHRGVKKVKKRRFVLNYEWEMLSCHETHV